MLSNDDGEKLDTMIRGWLTVVALLVVTTPARAVPTTSFENWTTNSAYTGNRVGGYDQVAGAPTWRTEMLHSHDVDTGHYNLAPRFGGGGTVSLPFPNLNNPIDGFFTFDAIVNETEFASGALVLFGEVPTLGIDSPSLLLSGVLRAVTIGFDGTAELGGHLRLVALFEWTHVSPLFGDWGRFGILESHAHAPGNTYAGVYGTDWSGGTALDSYLMRAVPISETGNTQLTLLGLVVLASVMRMRRRGEIARQQQI